MSEKSIIVGRDPIVDESRCYESHKNMKVESKRYRDWGTLRYALRSVEKYANWFRHEIFKNSSHLPTFNAQAIACHIHRIPGLAQHFLYMNDDFFVANTVELADFYTKETGYKVAGISPQLGLIWDVCGQNFLAYFFQIETALQDVEWYLFL
ncbi:capsular polysaccharide phosphotransferase eps5J-like [Mercenaria mercenaria]|uniref:capsular polysaccharide phosphotransferase eps5J-like n=1 Tax=Mercenaria mercenaria TaxID=6596 RepID=UPI00234F338E|nr:capsular polysaccharide phosphotransferase eps5J-like [Mercenaria mercenaria]